MTIKKDRVVKTVDDDSLSALWVTDSNSSRTDECDKHVKPHLSQRRGPSSPLSSLSPKTLIQNQTHYSADPTLPTARTVRSHFPSCQLYRGHHWNHIDHCRQKKRKKVLPTPCLHGWALRSNEKAWGQAAWPGGDKAGRIGSKEEEAKLARTENEWVKVLKRRQIKMDGTLSETRERGK